MRCSLSSKNELSCFPKDVFIEYEMLSVEETRMEEKETLITMTSGFPAEKVPWLAQKNNVHPRVTQHGSLPTRAHFRCAAICDDYVRYAYLFVDKIRLITVAKTMAHFRAPCMGTEIRVLFYKMSQGDVGEVHEKSSYYLFSCFTEQRNRFLYALPFIVWL